MKNTNSLLNQITLIYLSDVVSSNKSFLGPRSDRRSFYSSNSFYNENAIESLEKRTAKLQSIDLDTQTEILPTLENPLTKIGCTEKQKLESKSREVLINFQKSLKYSGRPERIIEWFVRDLEKIEEINHEYEAKYLKTAEEKLKEKSKTLKNKLLSGSYYLSYSDLKMFRIKFEDNTHIVLNHIDAFNGYKVEYSILKLNPVLRGNFLISHYTFSEFNDKTLRIDKVNTELFWMESLKSGIIGTNPHPLKLTISPNYLDYRRDLPQYPPLNLLLIYSEVIESSHNIIPMPSFSEIYNDTEEEEDFLKEPDVLNTRCDRDICKVLSKSANLFKSICKGGRFLINKKLVNIDNRLSIKENPKFEALNFIYVNKIEDDPNLKFLIKRVKNHLKIEGIFGVDKDSYLAQVKMTDVIKRLKPQLGAEKIKRFITLIETEVLSNVPIIFYNRHIYKNINTCIQINNKLKNDYFYLLLNSNTGSRFAHAADLISTFCYVLTKDQKGKNVFNVLHFNHKTGYIDYHINIKTFLNDYNKENKKNIKFNENYKLTIFILSMLKYNHQMDPLVNKPKISQLIQLSMNTLDNSQNISNLRKNKLKTDLEGIKARYRVFFNFIEISRYRKQECLRLFWLIYNNNPNVNVNDLIQNYNNLINSKKRKLSNAVFDWE